jgi:hypothetical protein
MTTRTAALLEKAKELLDSSLERTHHAARIGMTSARD